MFEASTEVAGVVIRCTDESVGQANQGVNYGSRADRTDLVVHDMDSGQRQVVLSWNEPLPASHLAISGDGRWVTYLDSDCGERGHGLARTLPVPTRGGSCGGTWYVVAAEAGAVPRALGTCTVRREREISIGCERSRAAPAGSRLVWGDDDAVPDGFAALGWSPGDPPRPFSPIVTPDGTLVFGVRHVSDRRYRGNALLSMKLAPDGRSNPEVSDLQPIVTLPAMGTDDQGSSNTGRLGQVIWSADGAAWVFSGPSSPTADDPYGHRGHVWVGLTDGSAVWDASEVLRGAQGMAWVPTTP